MFWKVLKIPKLKVGERIHLFVEQLNDIKNLWGNYFLR
jgi:hypothetical protein